MPWRQSLARLVREGTYRSQGELVQALQAQGFAVNQGTVSRELAELGAMKQEGVYRLPGPAELPAPISRVALTAGGCLAVLHTTPAFAQAIGQALDAAGIEGYLGCVAGDDTIFCALQGPEAAERFLTWLGHPPTA